MSVTGLATVVAGLLLIVAEGPIRDSYLAELVALPLVLALGSGGSGLDDLVDQLLGVVHFLLCVSSDQAMERLLLVVSTEFLSDFFDLNAKNVGVELFRSHSCGNSNLQTV